MRSLSALSLVLALGACAFGLPISPLVIKVSHSGNFLQGQTNAFYLIRVSNPGPTTSTGTVMVTDQAQSGLKITSLSGYGWNCSNVACWRSDSLAAGASYPAIMALATVDANAPPQFTHTATVHVDSTRYVTASDVTAIETNGYPIAWGTNYYGQMSVPAGLTNVVAVSAGGDHSLALKSDGTVVAWGEDWYGQTDVPKGLKNVVAVSAGGGQNLALTSDGTVVSWGANADRLRSLPLSVTKCATGYYCSPNRGHVVAIAAGGAHSLALKGDGTVVAWGQNYYGETNVPAGLKNVVAIAAGAYHSMALKSDGTVVDWPGNSVPAGLTNVVATAEGWSHNLALKSNGTVVAWGDDSYGQTKVPAGLTNVVAVAAGDWNSLALKSDGTVVSWGRDDAAQSTVPDGLASVFAIAGGGAYSLAVTSSPTSYIPVTFTATPCLPFEVDGKT
ncbi:MAG: hypothetical protein ABSC08_15685, partial [Bryobacteraceae bacterium]